jgi:hypothetical protein
LEEVEGADANEPDDDDPDENDLSGVAVGADCHVVDGAQGLAGGWVARSMGTLLVSSEPVLKNLLQ